jgi:hypothetical protein
VLARPTEIWLALNFPEIADNDPLYCCTVIGAVIQGNGKKCIPACQAVVFVKEFNRHVATGQRYTY